MPVVPNQYSTEKGYLCAITECNASYRTLIKDAGVNIPADLISNARAEYVARTHVEFPVGKGMIRRCAIKQKQQPSLSEFIRGKVAAYLWTNR